VGQKVVLKGYTDNRVASRLMSMGLLPGISLVLIRKSLLGSTYYIKAGQQFLALRKSEACSIQTECS
jgi:Fe2+ transport system protein FeoA